jgi:hypothetical protein
MKKTIDIEKVTNESNEDVILMSTENTQNRIIHKRKYGKTKCYFYVDGNPVIVIGPHCNLLLN